MRGAAAAALIVAALAVGGSALGLGRQVSSGPESLPSHPTYEEAGLRYEYDALIDREFLFSTSDTCLPPNDLSAGRPEDVRRLRGKLLQRLSIDGLDVLREAHREAGEALARLGYL